MTSQVVPLAETGSEQLARIRNENCETPDIAQTSRYHMRCVEQYTIKHIKQHHFIQYPYINTKRLR